MWSCSGLCNEQVVVISTEADDIILDPKLVGASEGGSG